MSSGGKYGQLVVISRSGGDGKAFPMHTTRVLIGRKETCDIRMQRAHVSKEHCVIRVIDNEVVLKNLSENCTSVNTHVLEAGQQRALKSGDVITIVGRSLRFEESTGTSVTPQGPSRVPNAPQTVGAPNGVVRPPLVFASGGGGGGDVQRQLRRRLGRTPRNPDTARKLELWEAHYSGSKSTGCLDIGEESPPPTLVASRQQSPADSDDPFAASASSGEERGVFERMAQSVGRGGAEGARRDEGVSAEVARIMGQISDMARITTTPLLSSRKRPRSPAEDGGNERRRSRSLERMEGAAREPKERTPAGAAGARAEYGSEDETSRATLGVSPQSTYSRSPTLQRQRQGTPSAAAAAVAAAAVVVQRSKPLQRAGSLSAARAPEAKRALTPAVFYSSLPRPAYSSVGASRRAASNGSPTRPAGQSSPLKRTLSSNSAVATRRPPPPSALPPALPASGSDDDDEEEVPTEPEPESDGEPPAVAERTTPERKRPALATQESIARKSVRFGPALSPELFDVAAPPSTPLRRGTPMQMAGRASSSILRRSSPTRLAPPRAPSPVSPSPSLLLGSLLTPRPSRRQAMHQYIASLSALAESPAFGKPPSPQHVPEEDPQEELRNHDEEPLEDPKSHDEEPMEPAVDIQSPAVLSPEDRRQRRRRSVRLAATHRRATLDSPLRRESPSSSSSPLLVVRRAAESPTRRPIISLSAQRRERRRTAPAISADFRAEMAEMAAALGEDVPALFAPQKNEQKEKEETADPVIEPEIAAVPEAAPLPPPLGLADAMQQEANDDDDEGEDESEVPAAEEATSSNVVLLEQAERQARIQGTDAPVGDSSGVWARLAGLSVTSPPPTPVTFSSPQASSSRQRQGRRQTIGGFAQQPLVTSDVEVSSVDEILAQRQRLRRIQDRKRRRQTVAELNKRRSSWRGWMPAVDSPPSSPTGGSVAHHAPPDWSTPHVSASERETTLASSSTPSSSHMYPPTAWNCNERVLSPNRMRGFTNRVATALGMGKTRGEGVELTNDPKHGSHDTQPAAAPAAVFAYPPRPLPIDADWETIDSPGDAPPQDEEARLSEPVSVEASQQVELYAVSAPASEADNVSLFGAHMPAEPEQELPAAAQPQVLPAAANEHVLPAAKEQELPPAVQELPTAAKENALPAVVVPAPVMSVISPPTTRGKTNRILKQQQASKPPPTNAMRQRAATSTTAAASTRKRKAEEPAQAPVKRGRPPIGTAGAMRKTHESSVMSPPTTRSSKRKSHAA